MSAFASTRQTRPVAVAVDGTDQSAGALHWGVDQAVRRGTDLLLVHVLPPLTPLPAVTPVWPVDDTTSARSLLESMAEAARALAPDLTVHTRLHTGARKHEIAAASGDAQLLVLGCESATGRERLLGGATTAGVVARSECPVAVVPADWTAASPAAAGCVVVGLALRPDADPDVLMEAARLAGQRLQPVTAVHAWRIGPHYADVVEQRLADSTIKRSMHAAMEKVVAPARAAHPDVTWELRLEHGSPAKVLGELTGPDDVVVTGRRSHLLHLPVLGETARRILATARGPVVVVPQHAPEPVLDTPVADESIGLDVLEAEGAMLRT